MKYKNIFTNPIAGIRPGGIGELEGKSSEKIKRLIELGMIEEAKGNDDKATIELTMESNKSDFVKSNVETLKVFCADNNIEITEDAVKKDILEAIFEELFEEESK
jgi:hypothetical protein